jgi:succinate dehydrogenase / fumarate reductase flavoprotein subunit
MIGDFLVNDICTGPISFDFFEFMEAEKAIQERIDHLIQNKGSTPVDDFHRRLGRIMWNECGMSRNESGLKQAISDIRALREEFWKDVRVPGNATSYNPELDKASRVADFLEQGELMCVDALQRCESCGGHFREEYQTPEGEALRDDENFAFVSAWEFTGDPSESKLVKEDLVFENIELKQRSYK